MSRQAVTLDSNGLAQLSLEKKLKIRAVANEWISENFPTNRKHLLHSAPVFDEAESVWKTTISTHNLNGHSVDLGSLLIDDELRIVRSAEPAQVNQQLAALQRRDEPQLPLFAARVGKNYQFRFGDGIEAAKALPDKSIDLLLTDPPYGISKGYTSETQVPRRLRKDGTDFIMPKGDFGDWDRAVSPGDWTSVVLPKVRGWFVTFCAQAQIGEYSEILKEHRFVAVGTLVWQKTNPVPFNHRYKPINAWEALVIGKRPGTKFNGSVVHNVFVYKSPSPQQRIHTTQKPLALMQRFVELFSDPGDFVYEPFAGSATTVVAASGMGRRVLAYEKDAQIYQSACERLRSLEG